MIHYLQGTTMRMKPENWNNFFIVLSGKKEKTITLIFHILQTQRQYTNIFREKQKWRQFVSSRPVLQEMSPSKCFIYTQYMCVCASV